MTFTVTPRHFLDFINQFTKMLTEKRSELQEQQIHLNIGLKKIKETVQQVDDLRKELAVKKTSLTTANHNANGKLQSMLKGQQEAEQKKTQSTEMRAKLEIQLKKCAEKKAEVEHDLAGVEPAVEDAKNAVKSIKKNNLQELKALNNPPLGVKMALESVCLLLGEPSSEWGTIRKTIVKDGFIGNIVNFDSETISEKTRKAFRNQFLNNPDYSFEKINKASKACGPLVKWASAQINYSDMLKRVDPLRQELKALMDETEKNKKESSDMDALINNLVTKIEEYKREYADLIARAEAIKQEMRTVESKVSRSEGLLSNLGSERERWQESSTNFQAQMSTLPGDCLLAAAFVAYAGYFDQEMRGNLESAWKDRLNEAQINYRKSLAQSEYLSTVDKRMEWQQNELPVDDLCIENAIMLERYNRYPLIIDPSGQATAYIKKQYADRKIVSTSFLDDSFRKQLESCLRFGNPILVHDAESYDPILNPVLNKEVRKSGGRVLITIGDQDIDLSPTFKIFLATRDTTHEFSPPLCSRVTLVNFTVTRSSLMSQCLSAVLRSERPDVDAKRTDMLKLQGEYQLRLRQLEQQLLSTLNDVKGKILDDDSVITALETLKTEAKEIAQKASETADVMNEIERVSTTYQPLSTACSSIFFTLDSLHNINRLYQFSLNFFFDIFNSAVADGPQGTNDKAERLDKIVKFLFTATYLRGSRSLLHQDRICFGLLLAKIELELFHKNLVIPELSHFLHNQDILVKPSEVAASGFDDVFTDQQKENLVRLQRRIKQFRNLDSSISSNLAEVKCWMENKSTDLPSLCDVTHESPIWTCAQQLLLEQAIRPSKIIESSRNFVSTVFGGRFDQPELNCADVTNQVAPNQPVILASLPGTDASYVVDDLARSLSKEMTSVAMGSPEGFTEAEKAISSASRSGKWVLLKNVHLAPSWLQQLEKQLHSLKPNQSFRLFLTTEISPKLPVNMLRTGRILTYEPPPGMRASLIATMNNNSNRMTAQPAERARLYFLLGWFHSVVQERMRYTPLGWSKQYELSDAELRSGMDTIDTWLDTVARGRSNIAPEQIPWKAIGRLLSQTIYGGKMDNVFDQRLLDSFLSKIFTGKSFEEAFVLANPENSNALSAPGGTKAADFQTWIAQNLPAIQKPSFMGLPDNAETVLLATRGREMIRKVLLGMTKEQEKAKLNLDGQPDAFLRPAWMSSLLTQAQIWMSNLPGSLQIPMMDQRDPLARYFTRESSRGAALLKTVRSNISEIINICEGKSKQTNESRRLCDVLSKQLVPTTWKRYKVSPHFSVTQWIVDFAARVRQLAGINANDMEHQQIWLGGLFQPEAWITATHQAAARKYKMSLEELELELSFGNVADGFKVKGLRLYGASPVGNDGIKLSKEIETEIEVSSIIWKPSSAVQKKNCLLPVYRNSARADLLFTANLSTSDTEGAIYERGVAITTAE